MPIEKINSIKNSYIANSRNINLAAPQKFKRNEEQEKQKELSQKRLHMFGIALLIATIATCVIGQKRGWWKSNNGMPVDDLSTTAAVMVDI